MKKNRLRIYIHIPFCIKKCNYCNFISTILKDEHKLSEYIAYLDKELSLYKKHIELKPLTIYIGGGTPSLFTPSCIYKLGDLFYKYINKALTAEFTIEANPESITREKVLAWKDVGINRVSLGVQSFDDNILSFLGRAHKAKDTIKAITILKDTFDNISFDLIYGIPGQDMDTWKKTLKKALEFEPQHISMYGLSIEKGTLFYRWRKEDKITLPDDALTVDMYNFGANFLREKGYKRYEISNFSLLGKESLHNVGYWTYEDFLGLGVSASSFIKGVRHRNHSLINKYFNALDKGEYPIEYREKLSKEKAMNEYVILRLRTDEGLILDEFIDIFNEDPIKIYQDKFDYFINLGLMEKTSYGYRLTEKGILVSNQIFVEIV